MEPKNCCELREIHDTLVSVCNAIVSVINVDITIVDNHLNRITGTGKYVMNIGEQLDENSIFAYALEKGESFIIENPKEHEACYKCEEKPNCKEWAQVCCPIKVNDNIIGIIGLIAFSEDQRDIILNNKKNLLEFLNRMADLIASKLEENRNIQKISLMARELEILLNSIDAGVISTDGEGLILRYNSIAKEIFSINKEIQSIDSIFNLVDGIAISQMKKTKGHIYNKEFSYKINDKQFRGYYNAKPIIIKEEITGFIFTFNKMHEIIKVVNDIASPSMITTFDDIIGESRGITIVRDYAKRISRGTSTVLIQGESGTGKELFARSIHYSSDRKTYPFVAINCTAIPENLIESELFGYEEGAFTGAKKGGKLGKFELANKGTIFLDEIGDMPINLQSKLLRVLQEGMIERVGGNTLIPVDVRVIAASNKVLEEKVREKEFREDLFYRLNVIPINIPPLRDRVEDVKVLANRFLHKFNYKLNKSINEIDLSVAQVLEEYSWPGNVRELENVIEYTVNMCMDNCISLKDLPRKLKEINLSPDYYKENVITSIKDLEKMEIHKAIKQFGGNSEGIERAAQELGISRATIYRKIKAYNIL